MKSVNKVILVATVGGDPDVRNLNNGGSAATFSCVTTEKWLDKSSGQQQEKKQWHKVVTYNRLAEIVDQYVKKGDRVYVEGRLETRSWEGDDGVKRLAVEILASNVDVISHINNDDKQSTPSQGSYQQETQEAQGGGDWDDDIPF